MQNDLRLGWEKQVGHLASFGSTIQTHMKFRCCVEQATRAQLLHLIVDDVHCDRNELGRVAEITESMKKNCQGCAHNLK